MNTPRHQPTLDITVNLGALGSELQNSLQTTINLVALSMLGDVGTVDDRIALPTDSLNVSFSAHVNWNQNERRERRDIWLLTNGVRDCIEQVGAFLESAHLVLSMWNLASSAVDGKISLSAFHDANGLAREAFQNLNFPDKVCALQKQFGIAVDPVLIHQVLSINQTRNCLVHRRGIVTDKKEIKKGSHLFHVQWRTLTPLFVDADGVEHPLRMGQVGPGSIALKVQDVEKTFQAGEKIAFTIEEFTSICWGLYLYSQAVVHAISDFGVRAGFVKALPQANGVEKSSNVMG